MPPEQVFAAKANFIAMVQTARLVRVRSRGRVVDRTQPLDYRSNVYASAGLPGGLRQDFGLISQPSPKVSVPLVLISQVQRSGGTLLSQLFDGHPQVLAFPRELHPVKTGWPDMTTVAGEAPQVLRTHDMIFGKFVQSGYEKFSVVDTGERHPFVFDFDFRNAALRALSDNGSFPTNRDGFNAFFTAFFAAWRNRKTEVKSPKCIVAFAARTNMFLADGGQMSFFTDYPDGHLLSVVRPPQHWYASARRHHPRTYGNFAQAMKLWLRSLRSSLLLRSRHPEQVILLSFERLVADTEAVMQELCERLGLQFDPVLLQPTFDGAPIKSDSSFEPKFGIDRSVLHRDEFVPSTAEEASLLKTAEALYRSTIDSLEQPGAPRARGPPR